MLGSLPANLHEDEILSGYVGRFIIDNGIDVYGNKWPLLYFNKFGDYYIILPFYLSGLGIWLFGPNAFGIRFFGALLGALAVFPVYKLTNIFFKSTKVALLSALVIAIMPWHINLSRTTVEGLMGTTIFSFGIVGLFLYHKSRRVSLLLITGLLFFVSYFFYHPFRIYVPLSLLGFLTLFFDRKIIRNNLALFTLTVFFFILTIYIGSTPWGSGRFAQTSIFSELSGVSIKLQERIFNEPNILQARIFNNKVLAYGREFLYQYSRYFSPDVLFVRGGNSPRVAIPEQGLLYLIFLPLIVYALYSISRGDHHNQDKKKLIFLFFLLFVAPLPAGLTIIDSPNIHRAVFMTVPLAIIIGYGLHQIFQINWRFRKVVYLSVIGILIGEAIIFHHQYVFQSDLYSSIARNDGQKQVVDYVAKNRHLYDKVYLPMEGSFPLYYLFYTNNFNKNLAGSIKFDTEIDHIDNVYFIRGYCKKRFLNPNQFEKIIVIKSKDCITMKNYKQIDSVYGVNPLLSFVIYAN